MQRILTNGFIHSCQQYTYIHRLATHYPYHLPIYFLPLSFSRPTITSVQPAMFMFHPIRTTHTDTTTSLTSFLFKDISFTSFLLSLPFFFTKIMRRTRQIYLVSQFSQYRLYSRFLDFFKKSFFSAPSFLPSSPPPLLIAHDSFYPSTYLFKNFYFYFFSFYFTLLFLPPFSVFLLCAYY